MENPINFFGRAKLDYSPISIGIKTFLRDHLLYNCITNIPQAMPGAKMIIADDGRIDSHKSDLYRKLNRHGHKTIVLNFDSGFGMKSNSIVSVLDTPFLLIASDDFDFSDPKARDGVMRMLYTLETYPEIDVISGRVNGRPYEFNLLDDGDTVTEIDAGIPNPPITQFYYPCDLTVNYCLVRSKVFKKVGWDDFAKIGQGEHASWFLDLKRSGHKVAFCNTNINEQLNRCPSDEYIRYRNRARSPERSCFKKRGIKKYVLASGQVDYEDANRG